MIFKIKTSKKTMDIFNEINASEHLAPYILSKLAISLSISTNKNLIEEDFLTDSNGLELNRQTITGAYDNLFKCLIEVDLKRNINDDEYFERYLKAHLERGASYLYEEYKYGSDFLTQLLDTENSI